MTDNLHDAIIRALVEELRPNLHNCTLRLCGNDPPTIRVDGLGDGNGGICTLKATRDGIRVVGAHDDLGYPLVEYCNPAMVDILVRLVASELEAFGAVKAAVRARFTSSVSPLPVQNE